MRHSTGPRRVIQRLRRVVSTGEPRLPDKSKSPTSSDQLIIPLFALIIGINDYPSPHSLRGAASDADAMDRFLTSHLGVPHQNIFNIRNKFATRACIIQEIESLAKNPLIPRDAAILIYFAGHGARSNIPKDWYGYEAANSKIEVICPVDIFKKNSDDKAQTPGIPDRVLNCLLHELAAAKGNNIILILDCCHSAGMSRCLPTGEAIPIPQPKIRAMNDPPEIQLHHDRNILSRSDPVAIGNNQAAYILLAAAARDQLAQECPKKKRGVFTIALLDVLSKENINELTYIDLMKKIASYRFENGNNLRNYNQTPHCEGLHVHRHLFRSQEIDRLIPAHIDGSSVRIEAGEAQGVTHDSLFPIFANYSTSLGSLAVKSVEMNYTFLYLPNSLHDTIPPQFYVRQIPCQRTRAYFEEKDLAVILEDSGSSKCLDVVQASSMDDADIRISLENDQITFHWTQENTFTKHLGSRIPGTIPRTEKAKILSVLRAFAHFRFQLWRKSAEIEDAHIAIEFSEIQGGIRTKRDAAQNLLGEDSFVGIGENGHSGPLCLTIHNRTLSPLYLYVFYFGADLKTAPWFLPGVGPYQETSDQSVPKESSFSIGNGDGGPTSSFSLPKGRDVDVGFLKLFLTTVPTDFYPLIQESPFEILIPSQSNTAQTIGPPSSGMTPLTQTGPRSDSPYRDQRRKPLWFSQSSKTTGRNLDNSFYQGKLPKPEWYTKTVPIVQKRIQP